MSLNRNSPLRVIHHVIDNKRRHFVSFSPFGLQKQNTIFLYFLGLFFCKLKIVLVVNNDFQLISLVIGFFYREFCFFWRKTNPVPRSRKRISSRGFDVNSKSFFFEPFGQKIHIPSKRLSSCDNHNFSLRFFDIRNHFFHRSYRVVGCLPTFFYITPMTAYITSSDSNEIGGHSCIKTLSLNGIKIFH